MSYLAQGVATAVEFFDQNDPFNVILVKEPSSGLGYCRRFEQAAHNIVLNTLDCNAAFFGGLTNGQQTGRSGTVAITKFSLMVHCYVLVIKFWSYNKLYHANFYSKYNFFIGPQILYLL